MSSQYPPFKTEEPIFQFFHLSGSNCAWMKKLNSSKPEHPFPRATDKLCLKPWLCCPKSELLCIVTGPAGFRTLQARPPLLLSLSLSLTPPSSLLPQVPPRNTEQETFACSLWTQQSLRWLRNYTAQLRSDRVQTLAPMIIASLFPCTGRKPHYS